MRRATALLLVALAATGCARPADRAGGGVDGSFCSVWGVVEALPEPDPGSTRAVGRWADGVVRALDRLELTGSRVAGQPVLASVAVDATAVRSAADGLRRATDDLPAALTDMSASDDAADRLSALYGGCTESEGRP